MVRTSAGIARTPYAVIGRCEWPDSTMDEWLVKRHRSIVDAKRSVVEHMGAWRALIGGLFSPLSWYVLDERDHTTHHLGIALREDEHDDGQQDGRTWHTRAAGSDRGPGRRTRAMGSRIRLNTYHHDTTVHGGA